MIIFQNTVTATRILTLVPQLAMVPIIIIVTISITLVTSSRDLRPSDHGLTFQSLPTRSSPDMFHFFGNSASSPPYKTPTTIVVGSNSSDAESDTSWNDGKSDKSSNTNKVRNGLVVATIVCGGTGVVLLLVAGILFALHFYKRQRLITVDANSRNNDNSVNLTVIPVTANK